MSNFIEVTDYSGIKHLLNINHIQMIRDNEIYTDIVYSNDNQDYLKCEENYTEIKRLIKRSERD